MEMSKVGEDLTKALTAFVQAMRADGIADVDIHWAIVKTAEEVIRSTQEEAPKSER